MKNRRFNIKKDFEDLVGMERILKIIDEIEQQENKEEQKDLIKNYIRKLFYNQFKN